MLFIHFSGIFLVLVTIQVSSTFGEKPLIEYRESSINDAAVQSISLKQRDKKAIVTFLVMAHGVLSAGFDIYKYARGCKDFEGFTEALDDLDMLEKRLRKLEDEINLAWVPFQSKESLFQRLVSSLTILNEQMKTYLSFEEDIVRLLDKDIAEKLSETTEELKEKIDENDLDDLDSIDKISTKYMSDLRFAYRTIANLQPLASFLLPKVTAKVGALFAGRSAANFASANPSRMQKIINYATNKKALAEQWGTQQKENVKQLIKNFKLQMKSSFQNFLSRHSKLNRVWNHLTQSPKAQARWKTASKSLKYTAKFAIYGGAFAYDVYLGVKFVKECQKRRDNAQLLVQNFTAQEKVMEGMKAEIKQLTDDIESNYTVIKTDLMSEEFTSFLDSMTTLVKDEQKSDDISNAISDIESFQEDIKEDNSMNSDKTIQKLISATTVINRFLQCTLSRTKIIRQAIDECGEGRGSMDDIFAEASKTSKNLMEECPQDQNLNKIYFQDAVTQELTQVEKKSGKCELNSQDKIDLVCAFWYNGKDTYYITASTGIGSSDVEVIKKSCPKLEMTDTMVKTICYKKGNLESLADIIKELYQYDEADIIFHYMECMADPSVKNQICILKKVGVGLDHPIFAVYDEKYSKNIIKETYNDCPK